MFGKLKSTLKNRFNRNSTDQQQPVNFEPPVLKHQKKLEKQRQKAEQLSGSQFRILNQLLYTNDSREAVEYFAKNRQHFNVYHEGFRRQSEGWSIKPIDQIISTLRSKDLSKAKIVDLGCGEAQLQLELGHLAKKIRSYDLVANNERVLVADIAHLPLKSATQHYAVFCLSLMGTNYIEFVVEALRVLKESGRLIIAEVESRSKDWPAFERMVEYLNCRCLGRNASKYFRTMTFQKLPAEECQVPISKQLINQPYRQSANSLLEVSQELLKPCIYKKR